MPIKIIFGLVFWILLPSSQELRVRSSCCVVCLGRLFREAATQKLTFRKLIMDLLYPSASSCCSIFRQCVADNLSCGMRNKSSISNACSRLLQRLLLSCSSLFCVQKFVAISSSSSFNPHFSSSPKVAGYTSSLAKSLSHLPSISFDLQRSRSSTRLSSHSLQSLLLMCESR